jgi:hypothetical protein
VTSTIANPAPSNTKKTNVPKINPISVDDSMLKIISVEGFYAYFMTLTYIWDEFKGWKAIRNAVKPAKNCPWPGSKQFQASRQTP